ncbi:MAG: hypothetical protein H7067_10475 [Burkholderiales bacterium]|nr:hypothetical protein [Opitutaceae bacterium]
MLAATKGVARSRLLEVINQVAAEPFRVGDLQQADPDGRTNEVLLLGDWLVTYWADHAVREVRVVALERVDEG